VDIFHTSPTAVRMFMKWGEQHIQDYDFDFRHMTTVGEPIQPEAWLWYYKSTSATRTPSSSTPGGRPRRAGTSSRTCRPSTT